MKTPRIIAVWQELPDGDTIRLTEVCPQDRERLEKGIKNAMASGGTWDTFGGEIHIGNRTYQIAP